METLQISSSVKEMLEDLEGETLELKLKTLIRRDLENRLRDCTERIYRFEKRYGMTFQEFTTAWEQGNISHKHSYEIEQDFMEWESLAGEHTLVLSQLRTMRETCHS